MTSNRGYLLAGLGCLIAGGAILAFTGEAGTVWGTTLGLAGLGLVAWGWARRR